METQLIPGAFNARDLGGLVAAGGRIRAGALFRSDAPVATGPGRDDVLRELGLALAVDLREEIERTQVPVDLEGAGVRTVSAPIMGDELRQLVSRPDTTLEDVYGGLLDTRGPALVAAIEAIAAARGPVLFFCTAGKDRTGLLAGVLLALIGVDDDEIVADYHRTEANFHGEFRDRVVRAAISSGIDEQQLAVRLGAPAALMRDLLARLRRAGGAEAYLTAHGLTPRAAPALRSALLDS